MKKISLATILLSTVALPAMADIVSTVGLTQIGAPASVGADFLLGSGQNQVIFAEQQNVFLVSPLAVDTGANLTSQQFVNSYFFAVNSANIILANTSVTFDSAVLGIIFSDGPDPYNNPTGYFNPNFVNSNFLGAAGTTYSLGSNCTFCGFEVTAPDLDTASFNGNTVTFFNNYSQPGDFARIITTVAVPGPIIGGGIPGMIAAGLLWLLRRKRRSVT